MISTSEIEAILGKKKGGKWVKNPFVYLTMLRQADSLLTRDAWIQGAYALDSQGRELKTARTRQAVKFCMLGAAENVSHDYQQYFLLKLLLAAAGDISPAELSSFNDSRPVTKVDEKDSGKEPADAVYARVKDLYAVAIKSLALVSA